MGKQLPKKIKVILPKAFDAVRKSPRTQSPVYSILASFISSEIDFSRFEKWLIEKGGDWAKLIPKLRRFLETGIPQWSIWTKGNSKLKEKDIAEGKRPFLTFSSMPAATCEGAGDCLTFCYSFRAWRYPNSWARQFQNWVLTQSAAGRELIRQEFHRVRQDGWDVRLFVDGDFNDLESLGFWFRLCRQSPFNSWYGYSKSLMLLLQWEDEGREFPDNYLINMSNGHKYSPEIEARIRKLPIYRGDFVAVPVKGFSKAEMLNEKGEHSAAYRRAIIESYREIYGKESRVFACPKLCGSCTNHGHACGSDRFRGVTIAIGIH